MLEGKELAGKIKVGEQEVGEYYVDAKQDATVEAAAGLKKSFLEGLVSVDLSAKINVDLIQGLTLAAKKIASPLVDTGLEALKKAVGRA